MISYSHIHTTLLYDVSRRWSLYLNRCVAELASDEFEAPGANIPFFLKPILVEIEGGHYVGPILIGPLVDLLEGTKAIEGCWK